MAVAFLNENVSGQEMKTNLDVDHWTRCVVGRSQTTDQRLKITSEILGKLNKKC